MSDSLAVESWRKFALAVLLLGMLGITAELLLLGHYEDPYQWAPLALLAVGAIVAGAGAVRPRTAAVRALRAVMAVYLSAAAAGLYLHIDSNVEFELEMRPSIEGLELVRESLTGAIPALAPGAMLQLGLLGLLVCFRHPALSNGDSGTIRPPLQET